jgi:hypothetical protein
LAARLAKQRRQLSPQMMGRIPPPSLAGFLPFFLDLWSKVKIQRFRAPPPLFFARNNEFLAMSKFRANPVARHLSSRKPKFCILKCRTIKMQGCATCISRKHALEVGPFQIVTRLVLPCSRCYCCLVHFALLFLPFSCSSAQPESLLLQVSSFVRLRGLRKRLPSWSCSSSWRNSLPER